MFSPIEKIFGLAFSNAISCTGTDLWQSFIWSSYKMQLKITSSANTVHDSWGIIIKNLFIVTAFFSMNAKSVICLTASSEFWVLYFLDMRILLTHKAFLTADDRNCDGLFSIRAQHKKSLTSTRYIDVRVCKWDKRSIHCISSSLCPFQVEQCFDLDKIVKTMKEKNVCLNDLFFCLIKNVQKREPDVNVALTNKCLVTNVFSKFEEEWTESSTIFHD